MSRPTRTAALAFLWATVRLVWACMVPLTTSHARARAYDQFDVALDHLLWVAHHPDEP